MALPVEVPTRPRIRSGAASHRVRGKALWSWSLTSVASHCPSDGVVESRTTIATPPHPLFMRGDTIEGGGGFAGIRPACSELLTNRWRPEHGRGKVA